MDLKKTALGIELGSTRIKAVLIDENHIPVASGDYEWENQLVNGIWTYSLDMVHSGIQTCFARLKTDVKGKLGCELNRVGAIGVSAMMHGYLPFDKDGKQLAEFRTWRNTITGEAAEKLTALFNFNIPQRWSIAHLYPIDSDTLDYDEKMVQLFYNETGIKLRTILPRVLTAGEQAGFLTEDGARFLDPSGTLRAGIPVAPCEGDAGTGMAATNSVRVRTGNVSAGTSDFAMLVTDHALGVHREIDMVTTPAGLPVAMVHCNNCTSDINAWVRLFSEFADAIGTPVDKGELYTLLFRKALEGEKDCGGLLSYNYFSGEGVTNVDAGRPLFVRQPDARMTLANFMRTHLLSALGTLKIGLDILTQTEKLPVDKLYGHGGFFKTPEVGQRLLSAAVGAPVSVMETAGEGGPYGMALLGAYMLWKEPGESLEDYLDNKVFAGAAATTIMADQADIEGFSAFLARYCRGLPVERLAAELV